MKNKICVYTVCMNEARFVNRWVDSMQEADKIVALVHDCTDNTEELLRSRGVIIGKTHYDKWRFDVGKNDAMHLAMKEAPECNIMVFTALDEVWEPGWAQLLKDNWNEHIDICLYKFVQTHNEDGSDALTTGFNWIHSNDPAWYWKYPIDERICRDDKEPIYLNLFDTLKLNHWPDFEKPRDYTKLHEEMWKEYRDDESLLCLVRDYHHFFRDKELISILGTRDLDSLKLNIEEKAFITTCLADIYFRYKKDLEKASQLYRKAIEFDPTFRTPYVSFGHLLCDFHFYEEAYSILKEGLKRTFRHYSWLESPSTFEGEMYIWLTVAAWYSGRKWEAVSYALKAKKQQPDSELANSNFAFCEEFIDEAL